jgi:hypothetical protein
MDLEGSGHGLILRYYPKICPEGQQKTMKNCQDKWFLGRDLNPGPPEKEVGANADHSTTMFGHVVC